MFVWRKILAHGLKRLATPALHLWRIRHVLVEELALCIKSLATPGVVDNGAAIKCNAYGFKSLLEEHLDKGLCTEGGGLVCECLRVCTLGNVQCVECKMRVHF